MKALYFILFGFLILTSTWLFLYSLHYVFMILVQWKTRKIKETTPIYNVAEEDLPRVTIQLPIFNEMFVAERLIKQVIKLDYPKDKLEIQVLDDSTDETVIITKNTVNDFKEKGFNIKWIHRKDRKGFKGGALKEALAVSEGEFVAIFDADFLPPEDFLRKTIPHFQDEKTGMVQCRWVFMNPEYSFLTRMQKIALDGHFVLEQAGRYKAGHYFSFNGSAGIWRKEAIYDAGDWDGSTLTEDLDLSYRAQFKGWKFKYLPEIEVPSELPVMMSGYKTQQFRWAKGFIQCIRKLVFPVLKSKASFHKKFEAMTHLTSHLSYLIMGIHLIFAMPMLPLIRKYGHLVDNPWIMSFFTVMMFFGMSAPMIFLFVSQKVQGNSTFKTLIRLPLIFFANFGLAVHLVKAVWEGIIGKKSGFVRTPKFNIQGDREKVKAGKNTKAHSIFLLLQRLSP